jgi:glycerol-3-phosphate dehydrogenase
MIVPRLYQGDHAYLLQNDDGRVVFVFPYEKRYSLIGTTDIEYKGDLEEIRASVEEVEYLCRAVNGYFRQQMKPEDVQWTYSGVRPLIDDGAANASKVSREYVLDMDEAQDPPILSVYGGKLTTFRNLSENVGNMVVKRLGKGGDAWTSVAPLPGGEGSGANFDTYLKTVKREYNWLPEGLALRLCRAYGTRARDILRGCKRISDMGEHYGADIYECELHYLVDVEFAQTLEDVLWRRSKLGLHLDEDTQERMGRALARMVHAKTEAA